MTDATRRTTPLNDSLRVALDERAGLRRPTMEAGMADGKTNTGSPDRDRIGLSEVDEVRDWCESLGCTDAELRAALTAVGNIPDRVREYLRSKK